MSLRFAILTALTERDATGLELSRRFDRSIGHFWPASHQQIYRELDRLAADGLVTAEPVPGRGQPKRYAIAAPGSEALRAWMGDSEPLSTRREALYVKLRAAAALGDPEAVRAPVEHHLALHEANLASYREIEARDFSPAPDGRAVLQHRVLQAGIELEVTLAQWCRDTLVELDRLSAEVGASR
ncbi:PadR family transcriptional regulator [Nocardioides insulae]|uniref:PadR family transcriptional regulator n=1 Tax=Nocardioides insulae TaxID=394734 RepID=UPI000407BF92|nr:PadR family transcriptional regulator [Nocardioides insulae]